MTAQPGDDRSEFVGRESSGRFAAHASSSEAAAVYQLSRDALRELDRAAVEEFGLPSIVLMENAAVHLARETAVLLAQAVRGGVMIVCGPGNNGGDGLALARHLANHRIDPVVILGTDPANYRGDAAVNLGVVTAMGLRTFPAVDGDLGPAISAHGPPGVVVDAVFGTGLSRAPEGAYAGLIEQINGLARKGALVLAVDIPSGLDADRGEPMGACVTADVTVTLVGMKLGFASLEAQGWLGEVVVADIGVPRELIERLGEAIDTRPGLDQDSPDEPQPDPPSAFPG